MNSTPFIPNQQVANPRAPSGPTFVTITGDSVAHTKGAYTELIAATDGPGYWVWCYWHSSRTSGSDSSQLMDIAIGSAGNEVIIFPNIQSGWSQDLVSGLSNAGFSIPFYVPSGSRISARMQGAITSDTVLLALDVNGGTPPSGYFTACDVYGEDEATSYGVRIVGNATADLTGAWTEIVASCGNPVDALMFNVNGDSNQQAAHQIFDFAVGAGGSEVLIFKGQYVRRSSSEFFTGELGMLLKLAQTIPRGSRLSCRVTSGNANDNQSYVHLHGLRL